MYELPLFPLNTVLFPGVPIFLNIFEPRYKAMLDFCLRNDKPFGVVLIREGQEAHGQAQPYKIGCTARVVRTEKQPGGNIHLVAVGEERFRILALEYDRPYLVGQVMGYPLQSGYSADKVVQANKMLLPWLDRYVALLSQIGNAEFDKSQLPEDAQSLAFVAAYLLQVPNRDKQALLKIKDTLTLLNNLRQTYRREVAFLKAMVARLESGLIDSETDEEKLFSLN